MRHASIAVGIAFFAVSTLQAAAEAVPKRRPGLWEITTVAAGTGMTTVHACIGADDKIATPEESGDCSQPTSKRVGADLIIVVVCKKKFGKQTMSAAFSGDFNSRYHAIMKITFDPPEGVRNMGVIIDGKYLGPDCSRAEGQPASEWGSPQGPGSAVGGRQPQGPMARSRAKAYHGRIPTRRRQARR